jgi:CheY-like chemotaxis protein
MIDSHEPVLLSRPAPRWKAGGRVRAEHLRIPARTPRGAVARCAEEPSREEVAGGALGELRQPSRPYSASATNRRRENLNGPDTKTVRLLLVDDRPSVRRGLAMWLALEPDLEVIGEAEGGAEAISLTQALLPDVVLMDVEMPGMDGISATAALRSLAPQSAVVILTIHDDAATRARAQEASAVAFVAKHRVEETLLAEIRRVARLTKSRDDMTTR